MNIFKILVILISPALNSAWRSFFMDTETLTTDFNPKLVKSISMKLINFQNHNSVNGSFVFLKDIEKFNIVNWVTASKPNGKSWKVYNITINGCQFLDKRFGKGNPIASSFLQLLRKFMPDLPNGCPVRKDKVFSVRNLYYNEEMLPPYLPETDFKTFIEVRDKNEYGFRVITSGYVAAKNGEMYRRKRLK